MWGAPEAKVGFFHLMLVPQSSGFQKEGAPISNGDELFAYIYGNLDIEVPVTHAFTHYYVRQGVLPSTSLHSNARRVPKQQLQRALWGLGYRSSCGPIVCSQLLGTFAIYRKTSQCKVPTQPDYSLRNELNSLKHADHGPKT